jgi:hypothetical protein
MMKAASASERAADDENECSTGSLGMGEGMMGGRDERQLWLECRFGYIMVMSSILERHRIPNY